jgi:uncharacterized protein with HEPN domain
LRSKAALSCPLLHHGLLSAPSWRTIIGEAAARIGNETKERNPQIPWAQIVAMRNRLVHLYFDIDLDQVWNAVTEDLLPLVTELQKLLEKDSFP